MTTVRLSGVLLEPRLFADGHKGMWMREYRAVEHPRLSLVIQRSSRDAPIISTWMVAGIQNHFKTAAAALEAIANNPQGPTP